MNMRVKDPQKDAADIVKEISSIYARWRAGELSQEDALFEIGDALAKWVPDDIDAGAPETQD